MNGGLGGRGDLFRTDARPDPALYCPWSKLLHSRPGWYTHPQGAVLPSCSHVHCDGFLEPTGPWDMRPLCTLRSETVVERMLSNWMSICLYQYLKVSSNPSELVLSLPIPAYLSALKDVQPHYACRSRACHSHSPLAPG